MAMADIELLPYGFPLAAAGPAAGAP